MKKIFFTCIMIVLCVSYTVYAQTTLNDALQYLQQKNYAATVDACNQLLTQSSSDPSVLGVRSLAYTALGKYDQAMQDAAKALSVDNTSDRAHFAKAEVLYYGQKDYTEALQEYNAAIKANAKMKEAYAGKARTCMAMQDIKEGMNVTENALKIFPNDPELYFIRGLLNFQRGKPKPAVDDYEKALSLNSKWNAAQVYLNKGIANEALLNYELAIQDFSKSIAADPNTASAYLARGNVKYALEQYKEAVEDFKKAEILAPDNAVITYNIGMAYYRDEDKGSACKYFQKSCSQGNTNACKMRILNCTDRKLN